MKGEAPNVLRFFEQRFEALQQFGPFRTIVVAADDLGWANAVVALVDANAVAFQGWCVQELGYSDEFADFRGGHPEFTDGLSTLEGLLIEGSPVNQAFDAWTAREVPEPTP